KQAGKWDQETIVSFFLCQYCSGEYLPDDKEHDINQVMFTIDLRASFFDKGKVFNQRHSACLLHGDAIRSQTICLFKFH
ncbi:hypothetical protein, partial [Aeromonas caviae]|uniref:hypothetical protein n=1 Tax=Aeromonas caviae TaxID=648 RepID=UPI002B459756